MEKTSSDKALAIVDLFEIFGPAYRRYVGASLPQGTSHARLRIQALLAERGPMAMADIGTATGASAQNVTGLIDALEAEGLIQREPHPTDRRKKLIRLTDDEALRITAERAAHKRKTARLFDCLSETEREHLHDILNRLIGQLADDTAA